MLPSLLFVAVAFCHDHVDVNMNADAGMNPTPNLDHCFWSENGICMIGYSLEL